PEKGTEFRINLPEGFNFTSLKDTDKLPNVIDPATYHVKIFEFLGDEAQFVLITGERCKYRYNSTSENYERQFCWNKPSFCRGNIIRCFQNDGPESLCYDESQDKVTRL
uniref:Uncharacterized protein n=1 Tax=Megaselia scalaris TaxID=36166 RepID=T1GTG7_MEGSC